MPITKSGLTPLSNMIDIIYSIYGTFFLITGDAGYDCYKEDNKVKICRISHYETEFYLTRIFYYITLQVKISWCIVKKNKNVDILVFFIGGDTLVIPAITAWLLRKKVILLLAGSSIKTLESKKDKLSYGLLILRFITCMFAKKIIVYSNRLIEDYDLKRWNEKILISPRHIIDFDAFTVTTPLSNRPPLIAYIGRLSAEKGILNFVQALPEILSDSHELRVLIIGDGTLKEKIVAFLQSEIYTNRVNLTGWISHADLPCYLNQLRLIVIPSDTEGLPNLMLEAMACGTPVLAMPVGAIPDVISDGKTGFIMKNNSPECISENVNKALNSPDLDKIAENGRRFVEDEFTSDRIVENWKILLRNIELA